MARGWLLIGLQSDDRAREKLHNSRWRVGGTDRHKRARGTDRQSSARARDENRRQRTEQRDNTADGGRKKERDGREGRWTDRDEGRACKILLEQSDEDGVRVTRGAGGGGVGRVGENSDLPAETSRLLSRPAHRSRRAVLRCAGDGEWEEDNGPESSQPAGASSRDGVSS